MELLSDTLAPEAVMDVSGARQFWERTAFLCADPKDQPCPEVIDVTGRMRDLIYGPYRPLSAGLWRAIVLLTVCPDAARRRMEIEFGVYPDFSRVSVPYGIAGRHELEITHALAADGFAEIRVHLPRAAFHGELRFEGAWVERIGRTQSPQPLTR